LTAITGKGAQNPQKAHLTGLLVHNHNFTRQMLFSQASTRLTWLIKSMEQMDWTIPHAQYNLLT